MRALRFLKWGAITLACFGILIPRVRMLAAEPGEGDAGTVRTSQLLASEPGDTAAAGGDAIHQTAVPPAPPDELSSPVVRAQAPETVDVALTAGGTLTGLVMDTAGYAVAGIGVSIYQDGREIVSTVTNDNGNFGVTNLAGGVYQIVAGDGQGVFRLWAPGTNPPGAQTLTTVVISAPSEAVEYVEEKCEEKSVLGLDVITLAILGLAIAGLVIALDDDDDPPPSSP